MSILNDPTLVRQIIMDHYQFPRNKVEEQPNGYDAIHMDSESCIDDFYIYLKYNNQTSVVEDCKYKGIGCTISTASISILSEMVIGKTKEEVLDLLLNFHHLTHNDGEFDENKLEELMVFSNIYKQANRIKCANIGGIGIEQILKGK